MFETITFGSWADVPRHIQGHCMERISRGVYRHHRLGLVLVIVDQCNTTEGVHALLDDLVASYELAAARNG